MRPDFDRNTFSQSDPSFQLPVQQSRSRKIGPIIIVVALIVAIIGIIGYIFWKNSQTQGSAGSDQSTETTQDQNSSSASFSVDATTNAVTLPSAWKKATSRKFGVSFSTPGNWQVVEQDQTSIVSDTALKTAYIVNIGMTQDFSKNASIQIHEKPLSEDVDYMTKLFEGANEQVTTTRGTWFGHDAVLLTAKAINSEIEQTFVTDFQQYYVSIGKYTYVLPVSGHPSTQISDIDDFNLFAKSIRITE